MKKLLVMVSLCAIAVAGLSAGPRADAANTPTLMPLQQIEPNPEGLKLRTIAPISEQLKLTLLLRAELSCQLFVRPGPDWRYRTVYLAVRNTGFINSAACWSYLKIDRPNLPTLAGFVATPGISPGSVHWFAFT